MSKARFVPVVGSALLLLALIAGPVASRADDGGDGGEPDAATDAGGDGGQVTMGGVATSGCTCAATGATAGDLGIFGFWELLGTVLSSRE